MLLHIDMDAFFASVEQAINPILKGRPLIVGSRGNKYHTVVCAASYEAKRLGIDSGMPTKEAFRICPQALFIPADSAKYLYVSNQIFELLKAYPCNLQYSSIDEFDLEFYTPNMDKNGYLFIGRQIKEMIKKEFQITCSIGIAPNWQLAKLGSKIDKPDGLTFIDHNNYLDTLKDMPISKICGVGPALTVYLNNLGITTCGQLLRYPKKLLVQRFGKVGSWLSNCLNPNCHEPLPDSNIEQPLKSIGHSYTLQRQTSNPYIISAWLRMLSEMVAQRLRKSGFQGHTIHIWINTPLNGGFSKQKSFQTGVYLGSDIFLRSRAILGLKKGKKMAVRALGISVSGLRQRAQMPLLNKEKLEENMGQIMDQINDKYGDWTIYPAVLGAIHNNQI